MSEITDYDCQSCGAKNARYDRAHACDPAQLGLGLDAGRVQQAICWQCGQRGLVNGACVLCGTGTRPSEASRRTGARKGRRR